MEETLFHFRQGTQPLLISIPHLGTIIPEEIRGQFLDVASIVADTDWHLDRVYGFAETIGASVLCAKYSRYAIDLNRAPSGDSLYPGQTTTGLCPVETFRGEPLYRQTDGPDIREVERRLQTYWRPYHEKLELELGRLKGLYGSVLLWDAHSIASHLPRLFDGKLPDLNIGTNSGASCDSLVLSAATQTLVDQPYTWVENGRFKGGYITRHYGRPADEVHAIQLEMCQSTYMDESPPFEYRHELAKLVSPVVEGMVKAALGVVALRNGR
jgi:N-formylglutamate deformylase